MRVHDRNVFFITSVLFVLVLYEYLIWYLFIGNLNYYIFSPIKRKQKKLLFLLIYFRILCKYIEGSGGGEKERLFIFNITQFFLIHFHLLFFITLNWNWSRIKISDYFSIVTFITFNYKKKLILNSNVIFLFFLNLTLNIFLVHHILCFSNTFPMLFPLFITFVLIKIHIFVWY